MFLCNMTSQNIVYYNFRRYKKERVIVVESPRPLSKQASKLVQKQTLKPESKSNWLLTIGPPPLPLWHWALK